MNTLSGENTSPRTPLMHNEKVDVNLPVISEKDAIQ
jgi:hypothetical protein